MSDVSLDGKIVHYKCVHLLGLGAFAAAGIMGALREMWGKKAEKCIWLARNWNKQGDHKRVVKGSQVLRPTSIRSQAGNLSRLRAARGQSIKDETLLAGLTGWPPCMVS